MQKVKCSRQLTNVFSILTKKWMTDYVLSIAILNQQSKNKHYFRTQKGIDCLITLMCAGVWWLREQLCLVTGFR